MTTEIRIIVLGASVSEEKSKTLMREAKNFADAVNLPVEIGGNGVETARFEPMKATVSYIVERIRSSGYDAQTLLAEVKSELCAHPQSREEARREGSES